MASSATPLPNQNTPYRPVINGTRSKLRIIESICNGFHTGVIPNDGFATAVLPRMLESFQNLLYKYGTEIISLSANASKAIKYIATTEGGKGPPHRFIKIGAWKNNLEARIGSLGVGFQYLERMVEYIGGAMDTLDDALIGIEVEMKWEGIKRYFNDLDESIGETRIRMRDICRQLADAQKHYVQEDFGGN